MAIIREQREVDAVAKVAAANDQARAGSSPPGPEASIFSESESEKLGWSVRPASVAGFTPAESISAPDLTLDAKIAALSALAELAPFEPVASVAYRSSGRLLVIADDAVRAREAIAALVDPLTVAVLWASPLPAPAFDDAEVVTGKLESLVGYLGAFELVFETASAATPQTAPFDLVLDLLAVGAFSSHQPPQGYFHADTADAMETALRELPEMVGEFDKPKFFAYKESLCAHSRSRQIGCNQCIEICSTQAIRSDGDKVAVDPHLCMGCGACATVCPSGAMSFQYPRVADRGSQLKTLLQSYRLATKGQGETPTVMFHNATDGRDFLVALATAGKGIPAGMLPLETWHVASTGIDVLMAAIAYGAGHVSMVTAGSEAPQYLDALRREMTVAQRILNELGYAGTHFSLIDSVAQLDAAVPGQSVPVPAGFNLSNDKRSTLEFVIEHLLKHAPVKKEEIALPPGSMFGAIQVNTQTCTLCMACAGACPESALMDGADYPRLKFLERNCVQCGLCEKICPENAITLFPRLLLTDARRKETVLNESEPFNCITCGKALGTKLMIDSMLGRLTGHSMFQGEGQLKRLQMCADCRVVDMMSNKHEASILTGRPIE